MSSVTAGVARLKVQGVRGQEESWDGCPLARSRIEDMHVDVDVEMMYELR